MAKNIDFMGAIFPDVPSIRLPQQGGGLVSFDDTTDADAVASDIAQGKTAYVNGTKVVGTASGSVTVDPLSVTQNGTYTAQTGHAYSPVTVNVSGGGASAWTKVAENTYQVTYSSTSTATVDTWATGHSELWTNEKWIYVRIRDTAGKRKGHFYGSDQFFMVYSTAATSATVSGRFYIRTASTGNYGAGSASATTGYGVYVDTIYSDGSIKIRSRYSSSYSLTIDGTYKVEVYLLEPTEPIFE